LSVDNSTTAKDGPSETVEQKAATSAEAKLKEQMAAMGLATAKIGTLKETILEQSETIASTGVALAEAGTQNEALKVDVESLHNQIGGNTIRIRILEQNEEAHLDTIQTQLETIRAMEAQVAALEETAVRSEEVRLVYAQRGGTTSVCVARRYASVCAARRYAADALYLLILYSFCTHTVLILYPHTVLILTLSSYCTQYSILITL
jgi:hypothetical protein